MWDVKLKHTPSFYRTTHIL